MSATVMKIPHYCLLPGIRAPGCVTGEYWCGWCQSASPHWQQSAQAVCVPSLWHRQAADQYPKAGVCGEFH